MSYLTKTELLFLKNKRKISTDSWGTLMKRIKDKMLSLKNKEIRNAMGVIPEDEKINIIRNLLESIDDTSLKEIIGEYGIKLDFIDQDNLLENTIRKKSAKLVKPRLNFSEIAKITRNKKVLTNSSELRKEINKIIKSSDFVLRRKLLKDKIFILKSRARVNLFNNIKNLRSFNKLDIKKLGKRSISSLNGFLDRGIVLRYESSKEDFLNRCRSLILKTKHKENTYFPKNIFPFDYEEGFKTLRLNPYYKHLKFETSSR